MPLENAGAEPDHRCKNLAEMGKRTVFRFADGNRGEIRSEF